MGPNVNCGTGLDTTTPINRLTDQQFVTCPPKSESHLVYIMQQHHVSDPQVFGCDGAVLQSMRVQEGHVLSVPQPHGSSFTHGQIPT